MAPSDHAEAAWGFLARLIAVMAVVAGLVLLIAPLCADGMAMSPVGSVPAVVVAEHDSGAVPPANGGSCAMMAMERGVFWCDPGPEGPAISPDGSPAPGAVLLACIAMVFAVLAVVLGLWPPRLVRVEATRRAETPRWFGVGPLRCPTLAELCVLRT